MKIVADENMPLVREMFSPYGEVETFVGRELSADHVSDADVLLVRSVTQVDKTLLEGSQVQFVGSATIGTDHVDQHYLQQQGIRFANAPGCNANGVVQYVLSVLFSLRTGWMEQTVGIVGCGNVGGRLYRTLQALGIDCRCYDPFLEKENNAHLVSFDDVLQSDILCLHTPLTSSGKHPTYHLLNEDVLTRLADNTLLINAGRGAVIDNQALLNLLPQRTWQVALDVWEQEPNITLPLLEQVNIGTPHIAGYSYDGKVNGTQMVFDAFCDWQGLDVPESLLSREDAIELASTSLSGAVLGTFDVTQEDRRMRDVLLASGADVSKEFDGLRKTCPKRLEFQHYQIEGDVDKLLARQLGMLKFNLT
ncbi:MAG: erythronate-4-phosphate dehydrogenase [Porticoccaceae bacterium]|nr:MAG: erythronate-4-phosphate dehydrogenase [Porticoccaceae bacterium]